MAQPNLRLVFNRIFVERPENGGSQKLRNQSEFEDLPGKIAEAVEVTVAAKSASTSNEFWA